MRDGRIIQTDTPEGMASNPADDYVRDFIDSADKTQIYSVRNIMQTPSSLIRAQDGANSALKQMQENGLSSVYVVEEKMRLVGILTLDQALKVKSGQLAFRDAIIRDLPKTKADTQVSDLIPIAVETNFPIAVIDDDNRLMGIVTKAAVLASLV